MMYVTISHKVSEFILALECPEVFHLPGLPSGLSKSPKLKAAFEILLC